MKADLKEKPEVLCAKILEDLAYIKLMVTSDSEQVQAQIEYLIDHASITVNKLRDLKNEQTKN